jgi:hypothetical protein
VGAHVAGALADPAPLAGQVPLKRTAAGSAAAQGTSPQLLARPEELS